MNIKKTAFAVLVTGAMTLSLITPGVVAEDGDGSRTMTATITNNGELTYGFTNTRNPLNFAADINTTEGEKVRSSIASGYFFDEQNATSPGFTIQTSASDFTATVGASTYSIPKSHLSMTHRSPQPGSTDYCKLNDTVPVIGGNVFQSITAFGGAEQSFESPINVFVGTVGRGCGLSDVGVYHWLDVPAGVYTGNGSAQYTSDLTISKVIAPD